MTLQRVLLLALVPVALGACDDDEESTFQPGPAALIRYINAVPDTFGFDFRIVDNPLENLPSFQGVPFGGTTGAGYHRVNSPGDRAVRIFTSGTSLDVVTQVIVDTTINFAANQRYTVVHFGNQRDESAGIEVFDDELPEPGGNIAIRVFNAIPGSTVDVHIADGDASAPAANPVGDAVATVTSVAYGEWSPYVQLPPRADPPTTADPSTLYTFAVTDAGSATVLFSATPNLPGTPASGTVSAQGGVRIPGSVLSLVLLPPVPADAPQAAPGNAGPTLRLVNERQFQPSDGDG